MGISFQLPSRWVADKNIGIFHNLEDWCQFFWYEPLLKYRITKRHLLEDIEEICTWWSVKARRHSRCDKAQWSDLPIRRRYVDGRKPCAVLPEHIVYVHDVSPNRQHDLPGYFNFFHIELLQGLLVAELSSQLNANANAKCSENALIGG